MKKISSFILIILFTSFSGYAQSLPAPLPSPIQMGAYIPGLINPRDLSNPGLSGLIAIDYNLFFSTDQYIDRNGNEVNSIDIPVLGPVPIAVDISGYINALAIAYVSPELSFLGGPRYIAVLAPLYVTADFRVALGELQDDRLTVDGGTGGFGDLGIAPLYLTWAGANDKYDITTGYMFTAPTGRYETGADDNIGLGYWNHILQLFMYYYPLPQKATAIYLGNTFEIHSKLNDVDVRPGNRYTLEYGVSQYLSARFEITVQGGYTTQVGEDSGDDVYWDTSYKDRYSTIGVGLGFWPVPTKFYTNFKWWTNYGIRQHFKFNNFQIQLIYIPGILGAKSEKGNDSEE